MPTAGGPHSRIPTAEVAPSSTRIDDALRERVRSLQLGKDVVASRGGGGRLKWIIAAAIVLVGGGIGYRLFGAGAGATSGSGSTAPANSADNGAATSGDTATAKPDPVHGAVVLESKGYIIPVHEILVSPKVSGMIQKLDIIEGQHVDQGHILAVLEDIDYKADLEHAKAVLASAKQKSLELDNGSRPEEIREAKAELDESEAQVVQLKSQWERTKKLHDAGGPKVVTDNEYEIAWSTYLAMVRHVDRLKNAYDLMVQGPRQEKRDAAHADISQAEADVAKAQWRMDNCVVRAPISGTITKKNAEEGNIVNPIVFNGSYSICNMANLADLEVDLTIQERDISHVFVGQYCQVHTDAYPNRIYDGHVSRLMPEADRAKGAIPVRVKLNVPAQEEGVYLKPEMGAIVSFFEKKGG